MALSYKNDSKADERLNDTPDPEQDQQEAYDRDFNNIVANYDKAAPSSKKVDDLEKTPNAEWMTNISKQPSSTSVNKASLKARFMGNKKLLVGVGVGGIGGIIISIVAMFLPLRLEMLIQNISSAASSIPSYAVERRTEYLVTRALATRILQVHDTNADTDVVFCKNPGIACSMFRTYTTDFFEKKYGIGLSKTADGNGVSVKVDIDGRTSLGGKALSWTIATSNAGTPVAKVADIVHQIEILDNGAMKKHIKETINTKMSHKTWLHRLVARNMLMRKYGVTHWRAFPKTAASIDEKRTQIRTKIGVNVYGRVSGRLAMAMTCMSNPTACQEVYKTLSASPEDISALEKAADDPSKSESERTQARSDLESAKARNRALANAGGITIDDDEVSKATGRQLSKLLSSKVMNFAGGPLIVIGALDVFFRGINAVDEGVLDIISEDFTTQAYIQYAYGDEVGPVVVNEQMKMGDGDLEAIGIVNEQLDGLESSPLWAHENGLMATMAKSIITECISSEDDEVKPIQLESGELVCPEMRVVRNYTEYWQDLPSWGTVATIADVWTSSISKIFDVIGETIGTILSIVPGLSALVDVVGEVLKGPLQWLFSAIFNPPWIGSDAPGANNYTALSGGIRIEQNELMKSGIDPSGAVLGGGGALLTNEEVAEINQEMLQYEQENFNSQSFLAKLFNPSLKGSVAQQVALTAPRTPSSALASLTSLPLRSLAAATSTTSVNANTSFTSNPFNMPLYGYRSNDPVLEADPNTYTDDACSELAAQREESYTNEHPDWPVYVYQKSDPCALERIVVGSLLADAGVKDDKYSLPDPSAASVNNIGIGSPGSPGNYPPPENAEVLADGKWRLKRNTDYSSIPCPEGAGAPGTLSKNPVTGTTVRICTITGRNVASVIAQRTLDMIEAANKQGVKLTVSSGYRTYQEQQAAYRRNCGGGRCNPPTATPGTSNHEFGVAIDFGLNGTQICRQPPRATCRTGENAGYDFLMREGSKYGFYKLPSEAWHWSMDGG